jgi:flavin-dependent dehydrogenase
MEFDALIVGSGVAGCATALELLSGGWRVGVLHRHDEVSAIESLPPQAVRKLEALSIRTGSALSEVVAWWGSEREAREIQPGARIARRTVLADAMRAQTINGGAIVIESGRLRSVEAFRGGWDVGYETTLGGHHWLKTKYLVDGTGRASVIGRRLGAQRIIHDQLFCISVSLHDPGIVGTWTESTSDGWWNLCCIQEEGTLSFYSTARIIREAKRDIADSFYETSQLHRLLPTLALGRNSVRPCGSSQLVPCAGPGWVSVGDAASTLQPLASAGVSKALRDARMVRRALEDEPADYDRFQLAEFRLYVRQLAQHYALEKRWTTDPFWKTHHPAWRGALS